MFLAFEYTYIWLPILLLIAAIGAVIWGIRAEKYDWNSGRCIKHGRPWINFDMDSQGGRGYKCRGKIIDTRAHPNSTMCTTWVSWWADKNYV